MIIDVIYDTKIHALHSYDIVYKYCIKIVMNAGKKKHRIVL